MAYHSDLTGEQVDTALTDIVNHTTLYGAEAWASGTKGGVEVGSSDATYHNNAKYYAQNAGNSAASAASSQANAASSEAAAVAAAGAAQSIAGGQVLLRDYRDNKDYYVTQSVNAAGCFVLTFTEVD